MEIRRLTITPIIKGLKGFSTYNPSVDTAKLLMKERLSTNYDYYKIPKRLKKLPENIPNWVNKKTFVH